MHIWNVITSVSTADMEWNKEITFTVTRATLVIFSKTKKKQNKVSMEFQVPQCRKDNDRKIERNFTFPCNRFAHSQQTTVNIF